jgi:hypothetical protein
MPARSHCSTTAISRSFDRANLPPLTREKHQSNSAHFQNPVPAETKNCTANETIYMVERCRADQYIADNQRRSYKSEPGGYRCVPHPNKQYDCTNKDITAIRAINAS